MLQVNAKLFGRCTKAIRNEIRDEIRDEKNGPTAGWEALSTRDDTGHVESWRSRCHQRIPYETMAPVTGYPDDKEGSHSLPLPSNYEKSDVLGRLR